MDLIAVSASDILSASIKTVFTLCFPLLSASLICIHTCDLLKRVCVLGHVTVEVCMERASFEYA